VKLPVNSIIPPEKVTGYLLVPQTRGDKSGYLELAGYGPSDAGKLLSDLRRQLSLDAVPTKTNKFGQYYEIRGHLTGPNGVTLAVRTVWMIEHLSGETRFVTLVPDKRKR
jgi:hypothetical protein